MSTLSTMETLPESGLRAHAGRQARLFALVDPVARKHGQETPQKHLWKRTGLPSGSSQKGSGMGHSPWCRTNSITLCDSCAGVNASSFAARPPSAQRDEKMLQPLPSTLSDNANP